MLRALSFRCIGLKEAIRLFLQHLLGLLSSWHLSCWSHVGTVLKNSCPATLDTSRWSCSNHGTWTGSITYRRTITEVILPPPTFAANQAFSSNWRTIGRCKAQMFPLLGIP